MSKSERLEIEPAYVELVLRVHANGRRERTATVYAKRADGTPVPVHGRLGKLLEAAMSEVSDLERDPRTKAGKGVRRVTIDARNLRHR
jgi:hypothetical protein